MNPTDLIVKLSKFEVDHIKYYNFKNELANIYDVCLLINKDNKILSRGISICSIEDHYVKKTGRNKSFGRAVKALENKIKSLDINPFRFENEIVKKSFKAKTKGQEEYVKSKLKNIKLERKDYNNSIEFIVKLPKSYSITETYNQFKYKSEFLPIPTEFEKSLLDKISKK